MPLQIFVFSEDANWRTRRFASRHLLKEIADIKVLEDFFQSGGTCDPQFNSHSQMEKCYWEKHVRKITGEGCLLFSFFFLYIYIIPCSLVCDIWISYVGGCTMTVAEPDESKYKKYSAHWYRYRDCKINRGIV